MKESNIQKTIQLAISKQTNSTMFRNNVGTGWVGKTIRTTNGGILIENPRPLNAGLCTGSSDLIGWTEIEITPDMIGEKVAVFTAIEIKTRKGKTSNDQINFCDLVKKSGGKSGTARTIEDAIKICK